MAISSISRYISFSRELSRLPLVQACFPGVEFRRFHGLERLRGSSSGAVALGWGRKPSGQRACEFAASGEATALLLEDGFIRSVGREDLPLSMVVDDLGIYYDAGSESRLERLISSPLMLEQERRSQNLVSMWRSSSVSKYNGGRGCSVDLPNKFVLVIDQVANDLSISYGGADAGSFQIMLQCALDENPDATVLLKVHPDAVTRKKAGHFDLAAMEGHPRIMVVASACHPVDLIQKSSAVYVVTSQVGFEALSHGKTVHCFGSPFYAGWGLTKDYFLDESAATRRASGASLEQLVLGR